ncbi:MAG TPA: superoxide dismutase, partial [Gemmatimonadales bacterium]|nr:superoxide dismutase [Gemmatimonadales bacterium]
MSFALPPLPYDYTALEPHVDEQTMRIHHDKHHAAYVNNLNAALEGQDALLAMPIEQLIANLHLVPEAKRTAVRNNGGGHANHTLFWEIMAPGGDTSPTGELASAIEAAFGSFAGFQEQFAKACATRFGSGWGWLSRAADGTLVVESTANQDSPL